MNEVLDARITFDEKEKIVNIKEEMPLEYTESFNIKYLKGGLKKVEDGDGRVLILVPEGKEVPEKYKSCSNIPSR